MLAGRVVAGWNTDYWSWIIFVFSIFFSLLVSVFSFTFSHSIDWKEDFFLGGKLASYHSKISKLAKCHLKLLTLSNVTPKLIYLVFYHKYIIVIVF
jgi:hypothetical protein